MEQRKEKLDLERNSLLLPTYVMLVSADFNLNSRPPEAPLVWHRWNYPLSLEETKKKIRQPKQSHYKIRNQNCISNQL